MKSFLLALTVIRNSETRSLARIVLEGAGHRVIESGGCAQAQSLLKNGLHPDILLVECTAAELAEGRQYEQLIRTASPTRICLITGVADQELCNRSSELGVTHFLTRPATREDIESTIDRLISRCANEDAFNGISPELATDLMSASKVTAGVPAVPYVEELGDGRFFLAASPKMLEIHRQVRLLANVDLNVLILGESGTGKEVIAHLIHKNSQRSREKFLNVNCAALPSELLESELFGHRQGAFTGAIRDRAGKFEQANRGTLLLDEIGEIPVQMQAKLLHVIQDGQFTRLGAQEATKIDVRVLAATNVQMEDALNAKTFREDLYYRLNSFTINVPPLRERREEIPFLIEETIRRTPSEMKSGIEGSFPSRMIDVALLYDWRGNLRELRNFVTRTIIMRDPDAAVRELEVKIAASSVTFHQGRSDAALPHRSGMRSVVRDLKDRTESQMIQEALEVFGWNRRRAAQYLNISYRALLYKIQQYHLVPASIRDINERVREAYAVRSNAT